MRSRRRHPTNRHRRHSCGAHWMVHRPCPSHRRASCCLVPSRPNLRYATRRLVPSRPSHLRTERVRRAVRIAARATPIAARSVGRSWGHCHCHATPRAAPTDGPQVPSSSAGAAHCARRLPAVAGVARTSAEPEAVRGRSCARRCAARANAAPVAAFPAPARSQRLGRDLAGAAPTSVELTARVRSYRSVARWRARCHWWKAARYPHPAHATASRWTEPVPARSPCAVR